MSIQITTINLPKKSVITPRLVSMNGVDVQSVNIYQTDGSYVTTEPFNNRVIWYPQSPQNPQNSLIGEWKVFDTFVGYGDLSIPMDARFDYLRRVMWIADAGNNRVLKVNIDSESVIDVANNGYFSNSLAININNGDIYVKAIKDSSTGIIQQYNLNADLQNDFEFDYNSDFTEEIGESYGFLFNLPSPFSMNFDHVRNRLWWIAKDMVYMIDVKSKNIVPYSLLSDGFVATRSLDIDFESGNTFVMAQKESGNWYVAQLFRDNNYVVSTAYIQKVLPDNRPYGV